MLGEEIDQAMRGGGIGSHRVRRAAAIAGESGRVSASWLIAAYLIIAAGEICLSPMGLSLVSRVAPPRSRGLMMGAWFVSLSAGGYLSGWFGSLWTQMPHTRFFLLVVAVLAGAAVCLLASARHVRRVLRQVELVEANT